MIGSLRGKLIEKQPTSALLDVHGVGYEVFIPVSTSEKLPAAESVVTLYTYLHVREDVLQLYGFATQEEKKMFINLIGVSGIGPKVALGILSGLPVREIYGSIRDGDISRLTRLPGVGKKTAERLLLELRDKVSLPGGEMAGAAGTGGSRAWQEAVLALTSLGYARSAVEKALQGILAETETTDVEMLIKLALRRL